MVEAAQTLTRANVDLCMLGVDVSSTLVKLRWCYVLVRAVGIETQI